MTPWEYVEERFLQPLRAAGGDALRAWSAKKQPDDKHNTIFHFALYGRGQGMQPYLGNGIVNVFMDPHGSIYGYELLLATRNAKFEDDIADTLARSRMKDGNSLESAARALVDFYRDESTDAGGVDWEDLDKHIERIEEHL